jgi:activator of HSP90 ATPase
VLTSDIEKIHKGLKVSKEFARRFVKWKLANNWSWTSFDDFIFDLEFFDNESTKIKLKATEIAIKNIEDSNSNNRLIL